MERTLILCKPDCMEKNLAGEVLRRLEAAGLRLVAAKSMRLTPALLDEAGLAPALRASHIRRFPDASRVVARVRYPAAQWARKTRSMPIP